MTQTVLLGDLINIKSGKARPKEAGDFPVYGGNGIFDSAPSPNMNEPTVIIGRVGAYCGSVYIEDEPFWLSDNALGVTVKDDVSLSFIYYLLKSIGLNKKSVGGAQPLLTQGIVNNISVTVPDFETQKKIAEVLGRIDEKIELNRQMNETLEQMGQALFRHYFIDNPEAEKWEGVRLKDVISSIKQPLKSGEGLADRIYLPIDRLQMKSLSILDPLDYSEAKSSLIGFEKDDILVGAMRVYFHRVNLAPAKGVTRTTTFVLRPNNEYLRAFSTLLINQESTITYANAHSKGSTMPYAIWENGLGDMPIKIPPTEILQVFQGMVWPMLETIRDSHEQIQTLTTLRDTLLPRLISGKVKIK